MDSVLDGLLFFSPSTRTSHLGRYGSRKHLHARLFIERASSVFGYSHQSHQSSRPCSHSSPGYSRKHSGVPFAPSARRARGAYTPDKGGSREDLSRSPRE